MGDMYVISLAVSHGASIHGKEGRLLPLQLVSRKLGSAKFDRLFRWLLDNGADLNAVGRNKKTPFSEVIAKGHSGFIQLCLDKGAQVILKDRWLTPPLEVATCFMGTPNCFIFKNLVLHAIKRGYSFSSIFTPSLWQVIDARGDKDMFNWLWSQRDNMDIKLNF